jgi:predicted dehydrogenase
MTTPLRIGMIGLERFGAYRRRTLRETGLYRIVAGYDLQPAAMEAALREDGAAPMPDYPSLVARDDIEAVFIATGAKYHAEHALLAMEHGKHVFIEKPLCCTPEEVDALAACTARTGRLVGLGHSDHRYAPEDALIRAYLQNGKLGTLTAIEVNTTHSGGLITPADNWRFDPEKNPGGILFQCGVHSFHHLYGLFGPLEDVQCVMRADVRPDVATADAACCLLRFRSGLIGTLNAFYVTAYNHRFRLFGTEGNLYFDTYEHRAFYQRRLPQAPEPVEEITDFPAVPVPADLPGQGDTGVRSFYQAVREGGLPYPGLREGIDAVEAVFACDRAAHNRRAEAPRDIVPA